MSGFLYGVVLQWKLDIRSKALLITCYLVPLLFFAFMGGIFTSINPMAKNTLVQSMTVMGVSMGAIIGLPPSLAEMYTKEIKNGYKANGIPLYLGLAATFISSFVHLFIMSTIILIIGPIAFGADVPVNLPLYFCSLAIFILVSISLGCILGLGVKNQSKLTMLAQIFFLPSIMLSGIMFPTDMLPKFLEALGFIFPASWGYRLMISGGLSLQLLWPLLLTFALAAALSWLLLKRHRF